MAQPSPSSDATQKNAALLEEIKKIRESKTVAFKRPATRLRTEFTGLDGSVRPFNLRYYQVQGIFHLLMIKRMILGDGTGLGKCVTGDTLLTTDQGLIPIWELAPCGELLEDTFHEPSLPVRVWTGNTWAQVKSFYWSGLRQTKRVTTRNGYRIEGSTVHPILVRGPDSQDFKKLPALDVAQDYVCIDRSTAPFPTEEPIFPSRRFLAPTAKAYVYPERLTPQLARLLGYIVAEAWTNNRYNTVITQHIDVNPEPHADIRQLLLDLFGWNGNEDSASKDVSINVSSIGIRDFLHGCGVTYNTAHHKEVPWCINRGTQNSVREFLRGLFEGEASISNGGVEFPSSSEKLARGVQTLLLRFGIVSTLSPKLVPGYDHTYWRLTFFGEDAKLFQERVGFVSLRKSQALLDGLSSDSNPNKDVVPYMGSLVADLKDALLERTTKYGPNRDRVGSGLKQFGESFQSTLKHVIHGRRNPTYRFLRQLLSIALDHGLQEHAAFREISSVVDAHYFYDPVVCVDDGYEPVMDIEVDHPDHCFSGNGLINHNTVQLIGFLCYLWDTKPDFKAIIVTPKSALRQWAGEFEKFTTGVKTYVVSGNADQRKAVYEAFAKHPTTPDADRAVLLINYHILVRDWVAGSVKAMLPDGRPDPKTPASPGLLDRITADFKEMVVIYDECFDYHTPITLTDGSTELIGRIVSKRLPVEVLSWNWETQQIESKRVVNWYRKPLRIEGSMLKVRSRFAGIVNVTRSHFFYNVTGGRIRARDLKTGSRIAALVKNTPTEAQEQLILGGLLGDAGLSHPERDIWGVSFCQSTKQEDYLLFKRGVLEPLGTSDVNYYQTEFQSGVQQMARFRLDGNAYVTSMLVQAGVRWDGRKCITAGLLDRIGPLGLAVWYGDDGTLGQHECDDGTLSQNITLHTEGFTKEENELLAGWLRWKWGVCARVRTAYNKKRGTCYHVLYLDNEATSKFLAILPGALRGVEYKFPGKSVLTTSDFDLNPSYTLVQDEVLSVEPWVPSPKPGLKTRYVFDIEVEDNHNYFANGALVSNCTAFKNTTTKTWQVCRFLSDRADRCYGLTATLLKNKLEEGFAIYKVIKPDVFSNKTRFLGEYCVTKLQPVAGGRKIPVVVGYKNLEAFRSRIDLYFLGRPKHVVSDELPTLITKEVLCEMTPAEDMKYKQALTGVLQLGDGEFKDYEEHKAFVALLYCQQIVDSLHLLKFKEGDIIEDLLFDEQVEVKDLGSKEQALYDLITEEFDEEKVIVYTRFSSLVPRLQEILLKDKIKSVAITGKIKDTEKNPARRKAQDAFQDPKSDIRVIFITDAGSEAINLQAASAIIFYDAPWSWGGYVQLLGRPIRIGSPHQHVVAVHLIAERPRPAKKDRKTIDHYTLDLLQKKKDLVDKVLGESAVGALDFDKGTSFTKELVRSLQQDKS